MFQFTFALRDACGPIKVSGGVSRTGDAVILPELCLIGPHWAANTAVDGGVVVMTWRTLNCREELKKNINSDQISLINFIYAQKLFLVCCITV